MYNNRADTGLYSSVGEGRYGSDNSYSGMRARIAAATAGDASGHATGPDRWRGAAASGLEIKIEVHKRQDALLVVMMPASRVEGAR